MNQRQTPADPAGVFASPPSPAVSPSPASPPSARAVAVSPRDRRLAEAGVLLTVLIWSANFVVVKAAIGEVGPLTFTTTRFVVATITLFLLIRWRMGVIRRPTGLTLRLIALGMLGFGCYQVVWTLGLIQITAGESALIVAASPVLVALLAGAVGMDRLTMPKLAGALIAFAGVALVIAGGHELTLGASLVGDALTLLAACLWAVYTVIGTRMLRHVDPLQATAWSVLGGTLLLLPFGIWEVATSPPVAVTLPAIAAVLYSGALAAGTANVLVFNAIRYIGPTRATVNQLLVPVGAVILGALFLAEPIGPAQVVGGAVIILGLYLTRRRTVLPASVRARLPIR
ncbi:MAG TPA: DMT family transporter [Candidatus Limnocylindrales bacterium]